MEKLKKSQNLELLPIVLLLIITPLLSTSLRFKYLYVIVNILIIAVGAEAGLLSFFLQSEENKKPTIISEVSSERGSSDKEKIDNGVEEDVKVVEKCSSEKICDGVVEVKMEEFRPPIFFIGGSGEGSHADDYIGLMEDDEREELYQKAEIFIGNFYKQLKMQREESLKKHHDSFIKNNHFN